MEWVVGILFWSFLYLIIVHKRWPLQPTGYWYIEETLYYTQFDCINDVRLMKKSAYGLGWREVVKKALHIANCTESKYYLFVFAFFWFMLSFQLYDKTFGFHLRAWMFNSKSNRQQPCISANVYDFVLRLKCYK